MKLMMKFLNTRGFTLIEVLIASALFVVSTICYFSLFQFYQFSRKDAVSSQLVKEILLLNIIEIRGNRLSDLPIKNRCVTRLYNLNKELLSSDETTRSGESCGRPSLAPGHIAILWEVQGPEDIKVHFGNQALKLPQYVDSVRKVKLTAFHYKNPNAKDFKDITLSIYKR